MQIAAPLNSEPSPALQWIEVSSSLQIPSFQIIGLPNPEVAEARERVRAAIEASGYEFPRRRIVLNLSPASVRKRGTGIDLSMALAVLEDGEGERAVAWGELGLDGAVKPVGQLTRALYAAWKESIPRVVVSAGEVEEARRCLQFIARAEALPGDAPLLIPAANLREAHERLRDGYREEHARAKPFKLQAEEPPLLTLARSVERAVGVAAAGRHHLLLLGPRGSGKSHALEWLSALEPEPHASQVLRHALLSELDPSLSSTGFIRRVGTQARAEALVGRIVNHALRPGEFSLADGGLLLADELPEWRRDSREALREPLERGKITLNRVEGSVELPASFTLAATANFCPCGGWPPNRAVPGQFKRRSVHAHEDLRCQCSARMRQTYFSRLSGPIRDRIDLIVVALPGIASSKKKALPRLRERVQLSREALKRSWGKLPGDLEATELEALLQAHPSWRSQIEALKPVSMRSKHKILRVGLSLAAWQQLESPGMSCFIEAKSYRGEDLGLESA